MFTSHMNNALLLAAIAAYLAIASPVWTGWREEIDWSNNDLTGQQLVIANMTANFQAFGVGREQAMMLAEQTADFGAEGMLVTVAALGISLQQIEMIALQHRGLIDNLDSQYLPMTATID